MIIYPLSLYFVLLAISPLVTTESNETQTVTEAPLLRCAQVVKKVRPRFHLVRRCARSDARVVIAANFSSLWRCSEFALFRRGLALNFGWMKGGLGHCEVLECPEHDTLGSLRRRENYDYYSLYANPLPSTDWQCLPKVGVFRIGNGEAKSTGKRKCNEWALMPTPMNKTKDEKGSSPDQAGTRTSTSVATARPDDRSTQELPPSPTLPSPTQPPPDLSPFPPFPFPPPFDDNNPVGPPFLPPGAFGGQEALSPWGPEYRLGESLNATNVADAKPKVAGQLANVLSQERTVNLTKFLMSMVGKFFPPVLVGLATVPADPSLFATSEGEPLPCFRFRAWAPGHPLSWKRLSAILQQRSSTSKPAVTHAKSNGTAKANATTSYSNSTQTTKNETMNNNKTATEITSAAERMRDGMTLCVYLHRDSLWHTRICSTRSHFLCELLPSGGVCWDTNSTDEREECEYEKIGTKDDRCSAWNGQMITTTMMPTEPEKGDGDGDSDGETDDGNDNEGEGGNNADDDNDEENGNEDADAEYDNDEPSDDNETGDNGDQENSDYDDGNNDQDNNDNSNDESDDTVIRDDTA